MAGSANPTPGSTTPFNFLYMPVPLEALEQPESRFLNVQNCWCCTSWPLGFVLQHRGFGKIRGKLASPSSSPRCEEKCWVERWRRTEGVFTLYIPIYLTRKPLHKWELLPAPLCHAAALSSFIQTLQLTREARLLI